MHMVKITLHISRCTWSKLHYRYLNAQDRNYTTYISMYLTKLHHIYLSTRGEYYLPASRPTTGSHKIFTAYLYKNILNKPVSLGNKN
jgi:hypothetical protein